MSSQASCRVVGVADQPGQLLQEERVAARASGSPRGQRLVRLATRGVSEQVARRLVGQAGQSEALGGGRSREPGQHGAEGAGRFGVLGAVGARAAAAARRRRARRPSTAAPGSPRRPSAGPPGRGAAGWPCVPRRASRSATASCKAACVRCGALGRSSGGPHDDADRAVARDARAGCGAPVPRASTACCRWSRSRGRRPRRRPAARAREAISCASRVLPIPASPETTHTAPRPVRAPAYGLARAACGSRVSTEQQSFVGPGSRPPAPVAAVAPSMTPAARGARPVEGRVLLQELGVQSS